jgi:hypothetical protein
LRRKRFFSKRSTSLLEQVISKYLHNHWPIKSFVCVTISQCTYDDTQTCKENNKYKTNEMIKRFYEYFFQNSACTKYLKRRTRAIAMLNFTVIIRKNTYMEYLTLKHFICCCCSCCPWRYNAINIQFVFQACIDALQKMCTDAGLPESFVTAKLSKSQLLHSSPN